MHIVDIVFCRTEEFAKEIFEHYRSRGYAVAQSTVEIETGTHGKHVVKRLDIMSK